MNKNFQLSSKYSPQGDQPEAIKKICDGFKEGKDVQTLLGVTGSGKTFTMANVIQYLQLPTLVISHNKTLAAQLCTELGDFLLTMRSVILSVIMTIISRKPIYLYRYLYREGCPINDEIDRRYVCHYSFTERKDVVIVASVSCI